VRNILLSSGRPLVRWEARGGLAEVHRWLEENRDPDAWIELNIWLTEALTHEQVGRLRASREGIVQIRPVYTDAGAEPETAGWRRSDLAPDELFRRFFRKQTGGAEPEDELVALFLELVAEDGREEAVVP
jgi:exonuclease SbcD